MIQAGTLISYYGWPSIQLRIKMMSHNWGKASIDLSDNNVQRSLKKSQDFVTKYALDTTISQFNPGQDAADGHNSPGRIDGCGVSS